MGRASSAAYAEELPTTGMPPQQAPVQIYSDPFSDDSDPLQQYGPSGACGDDYCGDNTCYTGSSCGTSGAACASGQCFVTADYLYVRSSFSEAVKFLEVDTTTPGLNEREINQF